MNEFPPLDNNISNSELLPPAEPKNDEIQETGLNLELVPPVEPKTDSIQVIERLGDKVVDAFNDASERKDKIANSIIEIDKSILLVFSIALLGTLFFAFYLIAVDKMEPVSNFLYHVISLVLGFMSGYFAGTGRTQGKK